MLQNQYRPKRLKRNVNVFFKVHKNKITFLTSNIILFSQIISKVDHSKFNKLIAARQTTETWYISL